MQLRRLPPTSATASSYFPSLFPPALYALRLAIVASWLALHLATLLAIFTTPLTFLWAFRERRLPRRRSLRLAVQLGWAVTMIAVVLDWREGGAAGRAAQRGTRWDELLEGGWNIE